MASYKRFDSILGPPTCGLVPISRLWYLVFNLLMVCLLTPQAKHQSLHEYTPKWSCFLLHPCVIGICVETLQCHPNHLGTSFQNVCICHRKCAKSEFLLKFAKNHGH